MHYLYQTDQIARRLVVTFWRATPEVGYSDVHNTGRPHDVHVVEEPCSPREQLEKAVVRLQQDIADYRAELELNRNRLRWSLIGLRNGRGSRRRQFLDIQGTISAGICSHCAFEWLGQRHGSSAAAFSPGRGCPQRSSTDPGVLVNSLSDHNSSPGWLAEYKRQFQRAFRRPGDDPSIFAIELETLTWRAFVDIDPLIQLQMVRDRFIVGQAECALRRHLDSLGPDTPMADIVDCSRVWESHSELASGRQMGTDRQSLRAVFQVTVKGQSSVELPETESMEDIIRKLLPTPARPPLEVAPIPSDKDLLIQRLIGAICPSQPVVQE